MPTSIKYAEDKKVNEHDKRLHKTETACLLGEEKESHGSRLFRCAANKH